MKLIRLLPEQIMRYWRDVKACIEPALPPMVSSNPTSILYIQEQLLLGMLECWAAMDDAQEIIYGVATTQLVVDPMSRTKNFLIYTVATLSEHPSDFWQQCAEPMMRYAKNLGCANVIAYTMNERIVKITEALGGAVESHLIMFKL